MEKLYTKQDIQEYSQIYSSSILIDEIINRIKMQKEIERCTACLEDIIHEGKKTCTIPQAIEHLNDIYFRHKKSYYQ